MSDCCPPAADPWTCCATVCADVCRAYRLTAWEGDIFIGRSIRPWPFIRLEVMTVILGACVTVFLNIRSSLKKLRVRIGAIEEAHEHPREAATNTSTSSSPSLLSPSAAPHPRLLGQLIGYARHLLHPSAHGSGKNDCSGYWLLLDPWRATLKIPWPIAWCDPWQPLFILCAGTLYAAQFHLALMPVGLLVKPVGAVREARDQFVIRREELFGSGVRQGLPA